MIYRFIKVTDQLYRGSAPSPKDVVELKNKFGIKKIVSLDKKAGDRIDRVCKLLNIKHIMLPIQDTRKDLIRFLQHNLKQLFLEDGPTFVHCAHGKDRTGLAVALVKCKYLGMSPEKALEEAKSLGFGIGVDPRVVKLYEKIILACKPSKDVNKADIVSNEREYKADNRDTFLGEVHPGSFAPYLDKTRQNPMDAVYVYINDQSPTRENYQEYKSIKEHDQEEDQEEGEVPIVGLYNNDAGARGFGPTENYGGFFYD